jgi:hypothetical protein
MLELMSFYILHRNWRARLAMNSAARWIWLFCLIGLLFLFAALGALLWRGDLAVAVASFCLALGLFASSFAFRKRAARLHRTLMALDNSLLRQLDNNA